MVRPTFAGSRSVVHSGAQGRREVGAGHGFRGVIPVDLVEMLEDLGATWCDLAIVHASRAANTEDVAAIHADHGAICWYFGEVGDDLAFGGLGRGEICASRATPRGLVAAKSAFLDATHADRGAPGADRRANRGDLGVRSADLAAVGADRGEVARSEPRALARQQAVGGHRPDACALRFGITARSDQWRSVSAWTRSPGGYFGATGLLADVESAFSIIPGGGRPSDARWTMRPLVPRAPGVCERGEPTHDDLRGAAQNGHDVDRAADRMYTRMYMKRRSVAAARANLPSLLDDVERGQVIEISRRGKAIAWLVPSLTHLDSSTAAVRFQARLEAWRSQYGDEGSFEPAFLSSLRDQTRDGR